MFSHMYISDMMKRVEFLLKTYQKVDDFNKPIKGKVEPSHVNLSLLNFFFFFFFLLLLSPSSSSF